MRQSFSHLAAADDKGPRHLQGGPGADTLTGGPSADTLDGGAGADVMTGGAGSDTYYVDDRNDVIYELIGGGTRDTVHTTLSSYGAPAGIEVVYYDGTGSFTGYAPGAVYAGAASSAYLVGVNGSYLYGGAGDDTLQERAGEVYGGHMYGGGGNDHFIINGGDGHATINGGGGFDLLTYDASTNVDLHLDLTIVGNQAIGDGTVFQQIEYVHFTGNDGNDYLRGGASADVLKGAGGSDTLIGGGGADTLEGDGGHDTLTGGAGGDTFRFANPVTLFSSDVAGAVDVVTDFTPGVDKVALIGFGHGGPEAFDVVTAAQGPFEAKPTVIVDTAAHSLSFDPDGTGAGAALLLGYGAFTTNPLDYTVS